MLVREDQALRRQVAANGQQAFLISQCGIREHQIFGELIDRHVGLRRRSLPTIVRKQTLGVVRRDEREGPEKDPLNLIRLNPAEESDHDRTKRSHAHAIARGR